MSVMTYWPQGARSWEPADLMKDRAHVAEHDGKIVGFYTLAELPDSGIELGHLFVDPSGFQQGYGAALLDHACSIARAEGFSSLEIQSDPNAADFYRAREQNLRETTRPAFRVGYCLSLRCCSRRRTSHNSPLQ